MTADEITKNVDSWKRAFDQVDHGDELSEILDYGLDEKDLANLAEIHSKYRAYRKKIEELLTDCNFHTECEWLEKGEYDKFQNGEDGVDIDELCDKADAGIKKVISWLKENEDAFGVMDLKLYDAAFYDVAEDFPVIQKVMDNEIMGKNYDPFYDFCEQEYDNLKTWCGEQGIDFEKMVTSVWSSNSKFYLHNENLVELDSRRGRDYGINMQATIGNLVEYFNYPDIETTEDGLVDREYAEEWFDDQVEDNLKYVASDKFLKDTKDEFEDVIKVYEHIKEFKEHQVEYFKSWLEYESEWLEENYADELAEIEEESVEVSGVHSINSVGLVTDAILEGKDVRKILSEASNSDKYALMNKVINKIVDMDADDFVRKYVDISSKEMLASDIDSRFLPFRMEDNEMMELSLEDGRLEYDGTSMGGNREFYFKVKEIEDILTQDYLN